MTLAERAASAKAEETAGLLEELRIAIGPIKSIIVFDQLRTINTPESLLAAAMMLVPEGHPDAHDLLRTAMSDVARQLSLHMRIAKPEDNYMGRLVLALIAAIAQSKGL